MSTTIRDNTLSTDHLTIATYPVTGARSVEIRVKDGSYRRVASVDRADFIAAVMTELDVTIIDPSTEPLADWERELLAGATQTVPADAVVIEASELLPVEVDHWGNVRSGDILITSATSVTTARLAVREWSSIVRHLEAHPPVPPVDEAQVAKIGAAILSEDKSLGRHVGTTLAQYDDIARSLYLAGVRIEAK